MVFVFFFATRRQPNKLIKKNSIFNTCPDFMDILLQPIHLTNSWNPFFSTLSKNIFVDALFLDFFGCNQGQSLRYEQDYEVP